VQTDGFGHISAVRLHGFDKIIQYPPYLRRSARIDSSILCPNRLILFVLYTADLVPLVEQYILQVHSYADDTQLFGFCPPRDVNVLLARLTACLDDVALWMRSNRLQLNTDQTELLWCSTARRRYQLSSTPLRVGCHLVNPATSVRNLGIYIDADLSG
jgi:hypothetical protein